MSSAGLVGSGRPDLSAVPPRARPSLPANATLVERHRLGPVMARFRLRPDAGPMPFAAGQYVLVGLPGKQVVARPYSIACRPGARDLDFVIALSSNGAFTPRLFGLGIGSRLHVGPARGLFGLAQDDGRDHLLVGTGCGVAPLLSMASELAASSAPPRTTLFHGVRIPDELAGRADLDGFRGDWFSYRPTVSRPHEAISWPGHTGHVGTHLRTSLESGDIVPAQTVAYLCGSPDIVAECEAILAEGGLPARAIKTERFSEGDQQA